MFRSFVIVVLGSTASHGLLRRILVNGARGAEKSRNGVFETRDAIRWRNPSESGDYGRSVRQTNPWTAETGSRHRPEALNGITTTVHAEEVSYYVNNGSRRAAELSQTRPEDHPHQNDPRTGEYFALFIAYE